MRTETRRIMLQKFVKLSQHSGILQFFQIIEAQWHDLHFGWPVYYGMASIALAIKHFAKFFAFQVQTPLTFEDVSEALRITFNKLSAITWNFRRYDVCRLSSGDAPTIAVFISARPFSLRWWNLSSRQFFTRPTTITTLEYSNYPAINTAHCPEWHCKIWKTSRDYQLHLIERVLWTHLQSYKCVLVLSVAYVLQIWNGSTH